MPALMDKKIAIVTGGASGLGLATVERFIREGAKVLIADIDDDAGSAAAARFNDAAAYLRTDVTEEDAIAAAVAEAVQRFGQLDVMVNNAGTVGDGSGITDLGPDGFDHTLAIDVRSVMLGHKHAARQFKAQGTPGAIVTNVSVAGLQGGWSSFFYATAKHAVVGSIRHAAKELSPFGIRTNGVAPGVVMTPLTAKAFGVPPERGQALVDFLTARLGPRQAMGRYGAPEDIANAVLFLASDLSSYVSGTVIPVDGGISSYTLSTSDADIAAAAREFLQAEHDAPA